MKGIGLLTIGIFWNYLPLLSQNIPGINYCVLFESALEKQAFVSGEKQDPLLLLMSYDPIIDSAKYAAISGELALFTRELQQQRERFRQEDRYLAYVFNRVHRRYLKHYNSSGYFNDIFDNGAYNCITGTALYAYLLYQLGYKVKIYETRLHVFTVAYLQDTTPALLEATDPLGGCILEKEVMNEKIQQYLQADEQLIAQTTALVPPFNKKVMIREITQSNLSGLHYYNMAIDETHQRNYMQALIYLSKAQLLYPDSERIADLKQLLVAKYNTELALQ